MKYENNREGAKSAKKGREGIQSNFFFASFLRALRAFAVVLLFCVTLVGCRRNDMADQPKKDPYEPSAFYADGASARQPVPGTVDHHKTLPTLAMYEAKLAGKELTDFPKPPTMDDLKRGRERYEIYCSVCHGRTGEGDGMIVLRGFTRPPAFVPVEAHRTKFPDLFAREQALVNTPPGHIYNVISNGYGAMYSYAARVKDEDRWRIAAYIKALQLSRTMNANELSPDDRAKLASNANATSTAFGSTTQPTQNGTSNTNKMESAPR